MLLNHMKTMNSLKRGAIEQKKILAHYIPNRRLN